MERYVANQGQHIAFHEMVEAFQRITGVKPNTSNRRKFTTNCQLLLSRNPLRWEFEINRCRGYAFDNGEGLV